MIKVVMELIGETVGLSEFYIQDPPKFTPQIEHASKYVSPGVEFLMSDPVSFSYDADVNTNLDVYELVVSGKIHETVMISFFDGEKKLLTLNRCYPMSVHVVSNSLGRIVCWSGSN